MTQLIRMVKKHEGTVRNEAGLHIPYRCSEGYLTVAYGYNIDANPLKIEYDWSKGVDDAMAEDLLQRCLEQVVLHNRQHFVKVPIIGNDFKSAMVREDVLTDMAYNLGLNGLSKFKRMIKAINAGDFDRASKEMLDSKWAKQVGKRAITLSRMMREGRYVS